MTVQIFLKASIEMIYCHAMFLMVTGSFLKNLVLREISISLNLVNTEGMPTGDLQIPELGL